MDYDSSLHHLEALQTAKKRDDIKINKVINNGMLFSFIMCISTFICSKIIEMFTLQAEEEMNAAKSVYEGINNELKEELPVLFERSDRIFSIII